MITPEMLARSGTEHGEQAALFCWAGLPEVRNRFPCLRWMFAIPNGGQRNKAVAGMLKAEGVKPGVADVMLPVTQRGYTSHYSDPNAIRYAGLFIEMKRANGKPSDIKESQADFREFVLSQGYKHVVAFGWRQAAKAIEEYLS